MFAGTFRATIRRLGRGARRRTGRARFAAHSWRQRHPLLARSARAVGAVVMGASLMVGAVEASDDAAEFPEYPFNHNGTFSAFDTGAVRRGFEVYRQVCSQCHSTKYLAFRQLVGTIYTEEQAKALAATYDIVDGPDETGEMFTRPGKLSDTIPGPFRNEEEARSMNGGAYPVDLSTVAKARHGGENYVFALLTGYKEPPKGITLREGLHYNPYFSGGAIAMAPPIKEGSVEYEEGDDTEPTVSQCAKDVSTFLAWASEPDKDDSKLSGTKFLLGISAAIALTGFYKRFRWGVFKNRKIRYIK